MKLLAAFCACFLAVSICDLLLWPVPLRKLDSYVIVLSFSTLVYCVLAVVERKGDR